MADRLFHVTIPALFRFYTKYFKKLYGDRETNIREQFAPLLPLIEARSGELWRGEGCIPFLLVPYWPWLTVKERARRMKVKGVAGISFLDEQRIYNGGVQQRHSAVLSIEDGRMACDAALDELSWMNRSGGTIAEGITMISCFPNILLHHQKVDLHGSALAYALRLPAITVEQENPPCPMGLCGYWTERANPACGAMSCGERIVLP